MHPLDFIDSSKPACMSLVILNVFFLFANYFFCSIWLWTNLYIPNLMFYQQNAIGLAIGFYFLGTILQEQLVFAIQAFFGMISFITNSFYLNELMTGGDWTNNFEGSRLYPQFASPVFLTTAQNLTNYDPSYNAYVGVVSMTFIELFFAFAFHFVIPMMIFREFYVTSSTPRRPRFNMCSDKNISHERMCCSWLAIILVIIGFIQCIFSFYFVANGIILLKPIGNVNFLVFTFMVITIFPPLYNAIPNTEESWALYIYDVRLYNEKSYMKLSMVSTNRILYVVGMTLTFAFTLTSLVLTNEWMSVNNVGGGCASLANFTAVFNGTQEINYNDIQIITYTNLTANELPSSPLISKTLNVILESQVFTCLDTFIDWTIFLIFFIIYMLQLYLVMYNIDGKAYETVPS